MWIYSHCPTLWMHSHYSSFWSTPSDWQSSRQQGSSVSAPAPDWLSLLAKAHWVGWANGGGSTVGLIVGAGGLPFKCWDVPPATSPDPGFPSPRESSRALGGLLLVGAAEGKLCALFTGAFFPPLPLEDSSLPRPFPPTDTTCISNPPLPRSGLFPAHWPTTMPAISNFPP